VLAAVYLQQGYLDKALRVASELVRLNPNDVVNHFKKAVLYQQKGDIGHSIEEFARVIEMEPSGELTEAAQEAVAALDGYQLRQIAALASEDTVFFAKLVRDPEAAVAERGFILSNSGRALLRQLDFFTLPNAGNGLQKHYN
jgi:tetratricopeptide (TPR) repeat protein